MEGELLTYEKVKSIILDELRHKGYAPNPADVHGAAVQIMSEIEDHVTQAVKERLESELKVKVTVTPSTPPPPIA